MSVEEKDDGEEFHMSVDIFDFMEECEDDAPKKAGTSGRDEHKKLIVRKEKVIAKEHFVAASIWTPGKSRKEEVSSSKQREGEASEGGGLGPPSACDGERENKMKWDTPVKQMGDLGKGKFRIMIFNVLAMG